MAQLLTAADVQRLIANPSGEARAETAAKVAEAFERGAQHRVRLEVLDHPRIEDAFVGRCVVRGHHTPPRPVAADTVPRSPD